MPPESPTQILKADHQLILRVIETLAGIADAMREGGEPPLARIEKIVTFSVNFLDKCHHGKEEVCLFPCLEQRGMPRYGGPIGVMLAEHEEGRRIIREIAAAIAAKPPDRIRLLDLCDEYVDLLAGHIFKENNILFGMADDVMTAEDERSVLEGYAEVESERMAPGETDAMRRLAEEIAGG